MYEVHQPIVPPLPVKFAAEDDGVLRLAGRNACDGCAEWTIRRVDLNQIARARTVFVGEGASDKDGLAPLDLSQCIRMRARGERPLEKPSVAEDDRVVALQHRDSAP